MNTSRRGGKAKIAILVPKTLSVRSVALSQLRCATKLHAKGEYVCALTLAGAAEELLGRIADAKGKTPSFDSWANVLQFIERASGGESLSDKEARSEVNRARNLCKHNDSGANRRMRFDPRHESAAMILRAVCNYVGAFDIPPRDRLLRRWLFSYQNRD